MKVYSLLTAALLGLAVGCSRSSEPPVIVDTEPSVTSAALARLSPEDRSLAESQRYCVVTEEPLGSMGTPLKLSLKGHAVFVCCKGCEKKALAQPDEMLIKAEELKAKSSTSVKAN